MNELSQMMYAVPVHIQQHSITSQKTIFFRLVSEVQECQEAEKEMWREVEAPS
jgi:hypothetical protein